MSELNLVLTLWGDWPNGTDLGIEYVNRMASMLERNVSTPHTIWLLTEADQIDEADYDRGFSRVRGRILHSAVIPLPLEPPSWVGCLPKLAAFNPAYGFSGTVLVIDLDTIITGNVDHFAAYDGMLCTRMAFREPGQSGGDIVAFQAGEHWNWLWQRCMESPGALEQMTMGRERYVYRLWTQQPDFWQTLYPGQYVSYKRHVRSNGDVLPVGTRLVSCHGVPRPHELLHLDWVKEHWR